MDGRAQDRPQSGLLEGRYDTPAMQRVLERAWWLQSRHEETFSAADLESVGQELGVEPRFVRAALAEMGVPARPQGAVPLCRAPRLVWAAPAAWGLVLYLCFAAGGPVQPSLAATLLATSGLAAGCGWWVQVPRTAFAVGGVLWLAAVFAATFAFGEVFRGPGSAWNILLFALPLALAPGATGLAGAWLRRLLATVGHDTTSPTATGCATASSSSTAGIQ